MEPINGLCIADETYAVMMPSSTAFYSVIHEEGKRKFSLTSHSISPPHNYKEEQVKSPQNTFVVLKLQNNFPLTSSTCGRQRAVCVSSLFP